MRWFAAIVVLILAPLLGCGGGSRPAPVPAPKFSTAIVGMPYLYVIGGTSCALISGSLPPGLAMNGCIISGIPTEAGTSTFTVSVQQ